MNKKAREYQRALISTKLDKIFAKPFVGVLTGHTDSISCFGKSSSSLVNFVSGSFDGEIRFWDLSQRLTLFGLNAHNGIVKGITFSNDGGSILSCGSDNIVNLYSVQDAIKNYKKTDFGPKIKYHSKTVLNGIDHQYNDKKFVTCGQILQIWNYERSQPYQTFEWGADSISRVKFNPSETNLLACTALDRSIAIYDLRGGTPLRKTNLMNKSSCLCWNPMEPINFTVGNDDGNCYSFDMRKMDAIKMIHKDHISAM